MEHHEIFEPYQKLVSIIIDDKECLVPENNSILRCLQYLDMEGVSDAELCWNGDCMDCMVSITDGNSTKQTLACRTEIRPGSILTNISEKICFRSGKTRVKILSDDIETK
ncbi:2Fe-2S iron-sulfur cluster-binding protein [Leptolyngbya sp. 7M]|uniref:2Fe-2S iron-sulfur cluster-binding protein n=1 Tax=Leptolyngbya sp. 7M TaxID=2812896 RepID=UPI001B8AD10E|nr:(2Fe-2S)-binding protein [Leptolyngbya sp. 7M]